MSVERVGDAPVVALTVTNTGPRESREVVQVYFQPDDADQPVRLVGWPAVTARARRGRRGSTVACDARDVAPLGHGRATRGPRSAAASSWWPGTSATSTPPSTSPPLTLTPTQTPPLTSPFFR